MDIFFEYSGFSFSYSVCLHLTHPQNTVYYWSRFWKIASPGDTVSLLCENCSISTITKISKHAIPEMNAKGGEEEGVLQ